MSAKVRGCVWCDQIRKGSRKVKASRSPRLHWVHVGKNRKDNTWAQRQCANPQRNPARLPCNCTHGADHDDSQGCPRHDR